MSRFKLAMKLLRPAKKVLKSFSNKLESNFREVKLFKAIRRSTNRIISSFPIHLGFPSKLRALVARSRYSPRCRPRHHFYRHNRQHHSLLKNLSAIYLDELFPEGAAPMSTRHADSLKEKEMVASTSGTSTAINVQKHEMQQVAAVEDVKQLHENTLPRKSNAVENSSKSTAGDAWKGSSLPQLKEVDERAEEFISKFREDMRLQREQSILEFQEMLARSA